MMKIRLPETPWDTAEARTAVLTVSDTEGLSAG
jgi:hypothetical protein